MFHIFILKGLLPCHSQLLITSNGSVKLIEERLAESGFTLAAEGILELWNPDGNALERCAEYGKKLAVACADTPAPAPALVTLHFPSQ